MKHWILVLKENVFVGRKYVVSYEINWLVQLWWDYDKGQLSLKICGSVNLKSHVRTDYRTETSQLRNLCHVFSSPTCTKPMYSSAHFCPTYLSVHDVSSSEYVVSHNRMLNEQWIGRDMKRNSSILIWGDKPAFFCRELSKI
jgi:hypothetical protein